MRFRGRRFLCSVIGLCVITTGFTTPATGAKVPQDPNLTTLHLLAEHPVDYGVLKVTIDHMVDPSVDVKATLQELDGWAEKVRARLPANADHYTTFMVLGSTLAVPGPWNDNHPFTYDLDDPFGKNIQNKLVSSYLKTRKGNCVSMPILLLILGQKLGWTWPLPLLQTTIW